MPDCTGFYGFCHLLRNSQHCSMSKAGGYLCPPIDAGHHGILSIPSELQCLFNHRCKIFVLADVHQLRISYQRCGKDPVCIAVLRRHQAVGSKQDWCRQIGKFFLLVLPCCAEISLEVRIALQFRVRMCRQHLTMGIDVDALACCLLQQQL